MQNSKETCFVFSLSWRVGGLTFSEEEREGGGEADVWQAGEAGEPWLEGLQVLQLRELRELGELGERRDGAACLAWGRHGVRLGGPSQTRGQT